MASPNSKRVVFIGMEETGSRCLQALIDAGANVVGAFTLDEEKAQSIVASKSFSKYANHGFPLRFIQDVNSQETLNELRELQPDLIYEVSWSQLISPEVLQVPRDGCVGMHCSLLPKHRGRAPIPWSIIFGLRRSGMSMFYLEEGSDLGDLIGHESFAIGADDSAAEVYESATQAAERLIKNFHPLLASSQAPRMPHEPDKSDYWPRRRPQDGIIDWDKSAGHLYDWVRALGHPFPGAFTFRGNKKLLVWKATRTNHETDRRGGQVLEIDEANGVLVSAGDGALWLTSLQTEDGPEMPAAELAHQCGLRSGDALG
jgi:methionyl-tRNA formyltransferase